MMRYRFQRLAFYVTILWCLLSIGLTIWDWQGRYHAQSGHYAVKLWVYWLQWGAVPWLIAMLLQPWKSRSWWQRGQRMGWMIICMMVIWAGLIEPNRIQVRHTHLMIPFNPQATVMPDKVTLALISDLHWGLFGRDHQLEAWITHLQSLPIDAVMVAGDWTYEPSTDLTAGFAGLKSLKVPVFGVLGNHDLQKPGPNIHVMLRHALKGVGVQWVEGHQLDWRGWQIIGLDDQWGGKPQQQITKLFSTTSHRYRLVLTHQPDTLSWIPPHQMSLGMAGHTHGGQIQIPWLTHFILQQTTQQPWYNGLYAGQAGFVFVTSGLGMIGWPFRWLTPPTIDLVTLQVVAPKPL